MSCPCPSGYTPTINSDDCIYTVTAATSGGTFFYTGNPAVNLSVYCQYGVFFYEDITNLSFPITTSGTTGSTTTENGTPLFSTQFFVDNSGRILNLQAGGNGTPYGPTPLTNSLWGDGSGTGVGRLNNAGLWTTSGSPGDPVEEWIGFSYCLDIPTTSTYFIGIASDNIFRLTLNNQLIVETNDTGLVTLGMPTSFIGFNSWSIFPITLNSGLNIIQMESLNLPPSIPGNYGAFAAEIYSGNVSTLSGYTTTIQLSADTIFSTLDFIGQDIPLSSSGVTTNTGYTCPSGYTLYNCSGTPYCIQIDRQEIVNYCVSDTGLGFDDYFKYAGIHNSEPYWSGETNGYVIFFTTGGTWCLSSILDGDCLLDGKYPCTSECPDLCDTYVFSGTSCPVPTPTPTNPCDTFDFNAIFDCEVTPTPSVTPTISVTPTMTPTPSTSPLCPFIGVSVTITGITPTVTPTVTPTPSNSPQVTRPCNVVGNITFNSVIGLIDCPSSKKFIDCANGSFYYASNPIVLPSGGTLTQFQTFKANVDGISTCVVFAGIDLNVNGFNVVELVDGPYNSIGDCSSCVPSVTQTPTVTPTPSITPTNTPTPTPSVAIGFYLYRKCSVPTQYLIQTLPGPSVTVGQIFSNPASVYFNDCWEYVSYSPIYPSLPLGTTSSFISGNGFTNSGTTFYNSCVDCQLETGDVA